MSSKIYDVKQIAEYVIQKTNVDNWVISNLKLQKVLYFIQAEFLCSKGMPCFEEPIYAVGWGVLIREVYHSYSVYGAGQIPYLEDEVHANFLDTEDRKRIDNIMEQCRDLSSNDLNNIVYKQTPWKNAYKEGCDSIITLDSIYDFFKEEETPDKVYIDRRELLKEIDLAIDDLIAKNQDKCLNGMYLAKNIIENFSTKKGE